MVIPILISVTNDWFTRKKILFILCSSFQLGLIYWFLTGENTLLPPPKRAGFTWPLSVCLWFISWQFNTRRLASARISRGSIRAMKNFVPRKGRDRPCNFFSSHLVWSHCKIWLLFLILCTGGHWNLGCWGSAPWGGSWPTLEKHPTPQFCYHIRFGHSRSNHLGVRTWFSMAHPINTPLLTRVTVQNLIILGKTVYMDVRRGSKNEGMLEPRLLERGRGWRTQTRYSLVCWYCTQFGGSRSNHMGVGRSPKNVGMLGMSPIEMGAWLTSINTLLPTRVIPYQVSSRWVKPFWRS